jgi:PAS domain S-box-containing protein
MLRQTRRENGADAATPGQGHAPEKGAIKTRLSGRAWLLSVAVTIVALLLNALVAKFVSPAAILLFPLLAAIAAAYMGGLWPGLLSTALTTVLLIPLIFQMDPSRRVEGWTRLLTFVFLGCVFSVLCDRRGPAITRIEEERRRAEENAEAARAAQHRLHLLLDGIKDYAIAMLDPQGIITAWNAGGQQIHGWQADEIVGQSLSALFRAEDRAVGMPDQILGTALRAGRSEEQGYLVRRDGTPFRSHTVVSPVFDEANRLRGFTLVAADVTEQMRAEEERGRLLAQIQQADLWQRTFLGEVLFNVTEGRLRLCEDRAELPTLLGEDAETIPLEKRSLHNFRQSVAAAAMQAGFPEERWQVLLTGASEVAMNAVVHGGGGEARIFASPNHQTIQIWIEDQGTGMALGTLHRATLEKGYTTAGTMGYGWFLTLRSVDRVWLLTGPSGTTAVLEQYIVPPEPAWAVSLSPI